MSDPDAGAAYRRRYRSGRLRYLAERLRPTHAAAARCGRTMRVSTVHARAVWLDGAKRPMIGTPFWRRALSGARRISATRGMGIVRRGYPRAPPNTGSTSPGSEKKPGLHRLDVHDGEIGVTRADDPECRTCWSLRRGSAGSACNSRAWRQHFPEARWRDVGEGERHLDDGGTARSILVRSISPRCLMVSRRTIRLAKHAVPLFVTTWCIRRCGLRSKPRSMRHALPRVVRAMCIVIESISIACTCYDRPSGTAMTAWSVVSIEGRNGECTKS